PRHPASVARMSVPTRRSSDLFGMGIERLLMALEAEQIKLPSEETLDCFFVAIGEEAEIEAVRLMHQLRQTGISVDKDYQQRKIKAQFRAADRLEARYVLILGDSELADQIVTVKSMADGE